MISSRLPVVVLLCCGLCLSSGLAQRSPGVEPTAAERGEKALLGRNFLPPTVSLKAYATAWKSWGEELKEAPARYPEAFMTRYGLHPAPYPNNGYPMGLR